MRTVITILLVLILVGCENTTNNSISIGSSKIQKSNLDLVEIICEQDELTYNYDYTPGEYIEIDLNLLGNGEYMASKDIGEAEIINEKLNMKWLTIVVQDTLAKHFETKADFLNHMDKGGYKPISQNQTRGVSSFIFQRK